ncbi:MAG: hypothetical protein HYT88_03510 [Candidatus Omnitrophica bacterium]|nr:hypothetical protein [Candidatus Omnitrophota bacterium]
MIGIICPSSFEAKALRRHALKKHSVVMVSGMGKLRALYACTRLSSVKHLRGILLVGFAGGLTSNLSVGDLAEPSVFVEQDYNAEPLEKFPHLIRKSGRKKWLPQSIPVTMLTQDRFLTSNPYKKGAPPDLLRRSIPVGLKGVPPDLRCKSIPVGLKGAYARKFSSLACDMESYAIAFYCERQKIRYGVLKLISDCADQDASHDFLKACQELAPKLNEVVLEAAKRMA